jgi:mono/diheme cytochrome c family protein
LFLVTGGYMLTEIPEINTFMIIKLVAVFASIPIAIVGFKKGNKMLALLSLLLLIAAYGLAEMSKKRGAKADAVSASTTDSKEIYSTYCSRCHGDDGKLGAMGAADLSITTLDNSSIAEIVRKGKGAMAGFEGQLSNEQISLVSSYVETLRKSPSE